MATFALALANLGYDAMAALAHLDYLVLSSGAVPTQRDA
jgi:hypothetical protein